MFNNIPRFMELWRNYGFMQRLINSDNSVVAAIVSSCRLSSALWRRWESVLYTYTSRINYFMYLYFISACIMSVLTCTLNNGPSLSSVVGLTQTFIIIIIVIICFQFSMMLNSSLCFPTRIICIFPMFIFSPCLNSTRHSHLITFFRRCLDTY